MLWFGFGDLEPAAQKAVFKNILCYGSALHRGQKYTAPRHLKTSYVMVRR